MGSNLVHINIFFFFFFFFYITYFHERFRRIGSATFKFGRTFFLIGCYSVVVVVAVLAGVVSSQLVAVFIRFLGGFRFGIDVVFCLLKLFSK